MNVDINLKNNIFNNINKYFDDNPKMSNLKFAKLIGTNESTVRAWRNGKCLPSFDNLPRVASCMGITLIELLGLDKDSYLSNEDVELIKLYASDNMFKDIVDAIKVNSNIKEAIYTIVKSK